MKETVNLVKENFASKTQYEQVIDTSFTQLIPQQVLEEPLVVTPTVDEFFLYYEELFFQIPKFGETNSHEYLIQTSQEYIGFQAFSEEITALTEEITSLREQLLQARQQLAQQAI